MSAAINQVGGEGNGKTGEGMQGGRGHKRERFCSESRCDVASSEEARCIVVSDLKQADVGAHERGMELASWMERPLARGGHATPSPKCEK
jgi:hypothetical protein